MTSEEQIRIVSQEAGFIRTVFKGMYYSTGEDVKMDLGIFLHPC